MLLILTLLCNKENLSLYKKLIFNKCRIFQFFFSIFLLYFYYTIINRSIEQHLDAIILLYEFLHIATRVGNNTLSLSRLLYTSIYHLGTISSVIKRSEREYSGLTLSKSFFLKITVPFLYLLVIREPVITTAERTTI